MKALSAKPYILIILLFMQACSSPDSTAPQQKISAVKAEKPVNAANKELNKSQKAQVKVLLSEINTALNAYKTSNDSNEIAAQCDRVNEDIENLLPSLPTGFFKNTLRQGSDALNLAYMFRYEKSQNIAISTELRRQVINTYKIGDLEEEKKADKLFNFAETHFEIASRLAGDAILE